MRFTNKSIFLRLVFSLSVYMCAPLTIASGRMSPFFDESSAKPLRHQDTIGHRDRIDQFFENSGKLLLQHSPALYADREYFSSVERLKVEPLSYLKHHITEVRSLLGQFDLTKKDKKHAKKHEDYIDACILNVENKLESNASLEILDHEEIAGRIVNFNAWLCHQSLHRATFKNQQIETNVGINNIQNVESDKQTLDIAQSLSQDSRPVPTSGSSEQITLGKRPYDDLLSDGHEHKHHAKHQRHR